MVFSLLNETYFLKSSNFEQSCIVSWLSGMSYRGDFGFCYSPLSDVSFVQQTIWMDWNWNSLGSQLQFQNRSYVFTEILWGWSAYTDTLQDSARDIGRYNLGMPSPALAFPRFPYLSLAASATLDLVLCSPCSPSSPSPCQNTPPVSLLWFVLLLPATRMTVLSSRLNAAKIGQSFLRVVLLF